MVLSALIFRGDIIKIMWGYRSDSHFLEIEEKNKKNKITYILMG